jgi:hypothetical protein
MEYCPPIAAGAGVVDGWKMTLHTIAMIKGKFIILEEKT